VRNGIGIVLEIFPGRFQAVQHEVELACQIVEFSGKFFQRQALTDGLGVDVLCRLRDACEWPQLAFDDIPR